MQLALSLQVASKKSFPAYSKSLLLIRSYYNKRETGRLDARDIERNCDLAMNLDAESLSNLPASDLNIFLYSAFECRNLEVARKVIQAMPYQSKDDIFNYVSTLTKCVGMAGLGTPPIQAELANIWRKVVEIGYDSDSKLLICLFNALSHSPNEQRNIIMHSISGKPPSETIDCQVLDVFIKWCGEDRELVQAVWEWGESVRQRGFGTLHYFSSVLQYYRVFGAPLEELKNVWRQIEENLQDGSSQLVCAMNSLFSDKRAQRLFIRHIISSRARKSFKCDVVKSFLEYCVGMGDKGLAERVWKWGAGLRERDFASHLYFETFFLYMRVVGVRAACELTSIWEELKECGLLNKPPYAISMYSALAIDPLEQQQFITRMMESARPAQVAAFTCTHLASLLKNCSTSNSREKKKLFASALWEWSEPIRSMESASTFDFFHFTIECLNLMGRAWSVEELESFWNQVHASGFSGHPELIACMCTALSNHPAEREQFIRNIMIMTSTTTPEQPVVPPLDCNLVKSFLEHVYHSASSRNDYKERIEFAKEIWAWSREIRRRERGSCNLSLVTHLYLEICGSAIGDEELLEAICKDNNDNDKGDNDNDNDNDAEGSFLM